MDQSKENTEDQKIDHGARAHAKHSPSSLKHKETCPRWESRNESSVHTEMGERMHEASEAWTRGNMALYEALPEAEQYFVRMCMEYVEPLMAGHDRVIPEERIRIKDQWLGGLTHGTPDLVILYDGDKAHIVDYKFGSRRVDSPDKNLQAFCYVLALFDTYEILQEITFHFLAPRIADGFQAYTFTRKEDYDRLYARVSRVVEKAEDPAQAAKPSWSACAYCANKKDCKALGEFIAAVYEKESEDSPEVRPLTPEAFVEALAEDTPENLSYLHLAASVVEGWAEARKALSLEKALEGSEVSGFEVRFKAGRSSVTNVVDVATALDLKDGELDKLLKVGTVSLASLESVYCEGLTGKDRTARKRAMMSKLNQGGALKTSEESPYLHRN